MLTTINPGDTAWILICTALAFLTIPGIALFYGGLARRSKILPVLTACITIASFVILQWVFFGYSLSFGPDHGGWIGTLARAGLRGVGAEPDLEYAGTVPHIAFMIYRGMPAALAPILFLAPFAERLRLRSMVCIALLWTTLIYDPVAHWIWGVGGFLRTSGVLDFAGGAPLYVNAGMAAFALAFILKAPRESAPVNSEPPDLSNAALGTVLLGFGWFGINAGNAPGAQEAAANALAMTLIAAAAAAVVWLILDKLIHQKLSPLGMMTGSVAGLAAISSAAGSVNLWVALAAGIGGAFLSYMALVLLQKKFGEDGADYAICIFGIGGFWGLLLAGIGGNAGQILIQLKAAFAVALYSLGMSWLLLKGTDLLFGLRSNR